MVTRLTLRTHELPETFGVVQFEVRAGSDAAFRRLASRLVSFCAETLNSRYWGEQIAFRPDAAAEVFVVFQGFGQAEAEAAWLPFLDWLANAPDDFRLEAKPVFLAAPARRFWDPAFLRELPGLVLSDDRAGAPDTNVFYVGNRGEAGGASARGRRAGGPGRCAGRGRLTPPDLAPPQQGPCRGRARGDRRRAEHGHQSGCARCFRAGDCWCRGSARVARDCRARARCDGSTRRQPGTIAPFSPACATCASPITSGCAPYSLERRPGFGRRLGSLGRSGGSSGRAGSAGCRRRESLDPVRLRLLADGALNPVPGTGRLGGQDDRLTPIGRRSRPSRRHEGAERQKEPLDGAGLQWAVSLLPGSFSGFWAGLSDGLRTHPRQAVSVLSPAWQRETRPCEGDAFRPKVIHLRDPAFRREQLGEGTWVIFAAAAGPHTAMVKALVRVFRWQRMLDESICGIIGLGARFPETADAVNRAPIGGRRWTRRGIAWTMARGRPRGPRRAPSTLAAAAPRPGRQERGHRIGSPGGASSPRFSAFSGRAWSPCRGI